MDVALIPPIPNLAMAKGRPTHLLLSHLLANPIYRDFYREERQSGSYLILDNSAHEHGTGGSPLQLLALADSVGADEVVVPDALEKSSETVARCVFAMDVFMEHCPGGMNFMFVPQGSTIGAYVYCLRQLMDIAVYHKISNPDMGKIVLGVSKDYERFDGGLLKLLEEFILPLQVEIGYEIHLLGWGRNLEELPIIASRYGAHIRSTDSAKPFVYGANGIRLNLGRGEPIPEYPKRSPTYFFDTLDLDAQMASKYNVMKFEYAAKGICL